MNPERAYARFLGICNMCVYMFSAESDTFDANLESDYQPFLRAYHASHRRIPFVALVNERRPVSAHERLDRDRVGAVLPVGVPILETAFPHPPRSDGHAMFLEFVDRILNVPLPSDHT
jgi:hypothetical protein